MQQNNTWIALLVVCSACLTLDEEIDRWTWCSQWDRYRFATNNSSQILMISWVYVIPWPFVCCYIFKHSISIKHFNQTFQSNTAEDWWYKLKCSNSLNFFAFEIVLLHYLYHNSCVAPLSKWAEMKYSDAHGGQWSKWKHELRNWWPSDIEDWSSKYIFKSSLW